MDTDTTTATVIATFNEAFLAHDPSRLAALLAEDCVLENSSPAPDGERFEGRAACARFWERLAGDGTISFDVEDVTVAGERATVRWRLRFGEGDEQSVRGVSLMHVRAGQIVESLGYVKAS